MKSRRLWVIGSAVAVVLLGTGAYFLFGTSSDKVTYRFEKADRGDISIAISATGTLSAVTTVQVGSQVSGTIAKLNADFNSVVREGQLLAQIDPTFLQATVNEQRAAVQRAQAQLNDAERTLRRTKELSSKNLVAQSDLDAAVTSEEQAKAGLASAQAGLDRAVVNLKNATITAPISGVVISRNVDVGQTVAASLQAPTLFTIANDLRKMQVQANIDEADIGNVKIGQDVGFRVDAYQDQEFHGTVSQVRLAPTVTQNVVMYTVIIDVANPDLRLMPGMTATVSILVSNHDNVLRVPIQATRFTPPVSDRDADAAKQGRPQGPGQAQGAPAQGPQQAQAAQGQVPQGRGATGPRGAKGGFKPGMKGGMMKDAPSMPAPEPVLRGRVWVMRNGKPQAIPIVRGLQNARYVEVVSGELKEGDEVIVGSSVPQQNGTQAAQNPFGPQRMGGGPGGGRRGGF